VFHEYGAFNLQIVDLLHISSEIKQKREITPEEEEDQV
jgi:hypothetical protein